ncbi:MAG: hypothetical protein ACKO37_04830 [Vampirovibrionales bacterium]
MVSSRLSFPLRSSSLGVASYPRRVGIRMGHALSQAGDGSEPSSFAKSWLRDAEVFLKQSHITGSPMALPQRVASQAESVGNKMLELSIPSLHWIKSGLIQTIIALDVLGIWMPRIGVSLVRGALPYDPQKDPDLKTMSPWDAWRTGKWRQLKALNWPNLAEETNREFASGPGFYSICILSYLAASKFLFKAGELTGLPNARMAHHIYQLDHMQHTQTERLQKVMTSPKEHLKPFLEHVFTQHASPDTWPDAWRTHPLTHQGQRVPQAQASALSQTTFPDLVKRYAHFASEVTQLEWQDKVVSHQARQKVHQGLLQSGKLTEEAPQAYKKLMKAGLQYAEKALHQAVITLNEDTSPRATLYAKDHIPVQTWQGRMGECAVLHSQTLPLAQLLKERQALGDVYHTYLTHTMAGQSLPLPELLQTALRQKAAVITAGVGLNIAMLFGLAWMAQRHAEYPANRLLYRRESRTSSLSEHSDAIPSSVATKKAPHELSHTGASSLVVWRALSKPLPQAQVPEPLPARFMNPVPQ